MRKTQLTILGYLLTFLLCFCAALEAHTQDKPKRVLFVGNSFIYFYNLPQMVAAMANTEGVEIITRQSTVGGSNLEQHWKEERNTQTRRLLEEQQWDYVVFNNHSMSAIETPESFDTYGEKFSELVRKKGAEPIFMITWGYYSNPLIQNEVTPAYERLAKNTNSMLVPAGPIFAKARTLRPDLRLYQDDKHPSENGTYLIALSFCKFFTGRQTKGLPQRLTTYDEDGELLYLCFLSEQDASFLQELVDDFTFQTMKK